MKSDEGDGRERDRSVIAEVGEYTGYGLTWALSVLLFLMGGWWLDRRIGTEPLFMILGAFLGAAAGFYSLYRHVVGLSAGSQRDEPGP